MLLMAADALDGWRVILDFQELTENSLSMWDTARPWAPQRLVQDNKTLVSQQVGLCYSFFTAHNILVFCIQIWPDTLAIGKGGNEVRISSYYQALNKMFSSGRRPEAGHLTRSPGW